MKALPERGRIGIHNRSYYEEVLVARVHPEILGAQQLPEECKRRRRVEAPLPGDQQLRALSGRQRHRGPEVLPERLEEGAEARFLERIDHDEKNWKFSVNDAKERAFWKDYMNAYEDVFTHTSTKHAPWYIIPADNKWFMRLAVAAITYQTLEDLDLKYPVLTEEKKQELLEAKKVLLAEKD